MADMAELVGLVDRGVLGWFAGLRAPLLDGIFVAVTWAGSLWLILPASLALAILAWRRERIGAAWLLALGPLGASLATWVIKLAVMRPRPDAFDAVAAMPADPSFPSGHTAQAAAFALACLLAAGRAASPGWLAAAVAYVTLVAASRLYLQVHFPSDVLAGAAFAALWLLGLHALLQRRLERAAA
jgi:undecaprenyl-diphosphatase